MSKYKIKLKTIFEVFIALLIPVVYFFLIGGFNGIPESEHNTITYDPLSVIRTDFVKEIRSGKYDTQFNKLTSNEENEIDNVTEYLINSQRVEIFPFKEDANSENKIHFNGVNGYKVTDSAGVNALYLSSGSYVDGREKLEKCYFTGEYNTDKTKVLKNDSALRGEWYIKPRMKIRRADFSIADNRPVAAIITYSIEGKMIDSTVIRVRNFSDLSGTYNGGYTEKYMTEFELPGDNMRISSLEIFNKKAMRSKIFQVKIYWFGIIDLWFEKLTIEDQTANKLLSGSYDENIKESATPLQFIKIAYKIQDNKFSVSNKTSLNYVMNVMHNNLNKSAISNILQTP